MKMTLQNCAQNRVEALCCQLQSRNTSGHFHPKLQIAIGGAGIGGLTASISLALQGHQVTCFEVMPEVGAVSGKHLPYGNHGNQFQRTHELLTVYKGCQCWHSAGTKHDPVALQAWA